MMKYSLIFLWTVLAIYWLPILAINNGIFSDITKEPWTVGIINKTIGFCGGSILSASFVLTSASCVDGNEPQDLSIHYGSTHRTYGGKTAFVEQIFPHPQYTPTSLDNDLAVLKIKEGLSLDQRTSKSIDLADMDYCPHKYHVVLVSGWGTQEHNPHLADILKAANFTVRGNSKCGQALTEKQFCAGGFGVALEYGDNGDPAVENLKLVGVGIWRLGIYQSSQEPSVFTCVGYYAQWIKDIMKRTI
ncbi:Trypsin-4 [Sarcoptes scabiei]|uniref:Trypsin-4 n=1 Tax=Sarcoptes scabiei TaxID=52283 RepID=A0A834RHW6_SARSC|nr:Trypsin-4 [Sarcoptes scabiei]